LPGASSEEGEILNLWDILNLYAVSIPSSADQHRKSSPFRCVAMVVILQSLYLCSATPGWAADPKVRVVKTPGDGIQPQAVVDAKGVLHLMIGRKTVESKLANHSFGSKEIARSDPID
jgi:hypothetical protein